MKKDTTELRKRLDAEENARLKLQEERDATVQALEAKCKGVEKEAKEMRKKLEESEAEAKQIRDEKEATAASLEEKTKVPYFDEFLFYYYFFLVF